ncbi:ECF family RNA polymerase sigma factor [Sorangium cellulosum]|uniref:ECF family RNA polymerase sigma factor n=1 Tax=Sorangium cellulosum TaxID=56 RepID=A0A2L0F090_SORCE|nr:sigma-70 family RNA polymerase sigma factor [Sorangium cellulosum]AUX44955.1 ECF family RNA polymerase sigma factor [Sorangium cellulosum]
MTRPRRPGHGGPPEKERAFELLFRERTFELVWRWLTRLGIPLRDRADLAQDILLSAYLSFESYQPEISRPERWLNRITVHASAHYRERAQHRYEELVPDEDIPRLVDESPSPEDMLSSEEERLMVLEVLQQLDVEAHSILVAHDLDGIPMTELARQRGIPLSTAYKWRARALSLFHDIALKRQRGEQWQRQRQTQKQRRSRLRAVPVDVAAIVAAARVAPRLPDDVRRSILRGITESVPPIDAGGAGGLIVDAREVLGEAVTWGKRAIAKLAQKLLSSAALVVLASAAATAAVGALSIALESQDGPPLLRGMPPAPAVSRAAVPSVAPPPPPPPPPPPAVAPVAAQPPPRSPRQPPRSWPPAVEAPGPAPGPATEGESLDLMLLEICTSAVRQRGAAEALEALERYEREVPQSAFAAERAVLWIRALRLAGRDDEARERIARARASGAIDRRLLDDLERGLSRQ